MAPQKNQACSGINFWLRIGFFLMTWFVLIAASLFLYFKLIDGSQWVNICTMVFGADRLSSAVSEGIAARAGSRAASRSGDQAIQPAT